VEKKYLLIIKADTNDADYVESSNYIDESQLELVKRVIGAIKSVKAKENWGTSEYASKSVIDTYEDILPVEDLECFDGWVPYGENGVHTIKSIRLLEVLSEEELL